MFFWYNPIARNAQPYRHLGNEELTLTWALPTKQLVQRPQPWQAAVVRPRQKDDRARPQRPEIAGGLSLTREELLHTITKRACFHLSSLSVLESNRSGCGKSLGVAQRLLSPFWAAGDRPKPDENEAAARLSMRNCCFRPAP